jgi:hypothetical protein
LNISRSVRFQNRAFKISHSTIILIQDCNRSKAPMREKPAWNGAFPHFARSHSVLGGFISENNSSTVCCAT